MISLTIIVRNEQLFTNYLENKKIELEGLVFKSKFLVLGGAGSIGQAVTAILRKQENYA